MRTSLFLLLLLLLLLLLNVFVGSVPLSPGQVWDALTGADGVPVVTHNIIWKSRLPQALTAMLAGAGLAVSGLQMQTVFRNPLAGPTVLGISNGASLGVALVVLLSGALGGQALSRLGLAGEMATTAAAIAGALGVMSVIIAVSARVRSSVTLLILGVMIGYVANALIGVLKFFSIEEDVRTFVVWGLGSFSRISPDRMPPFLCAMSLLLILSLPLSKSLNVLLLGEHYARNLGLNVQRARQLIILSSSVLCAVVTAYCGPIAFLGLAVPHLCRGLLRTSNHRRLLPACMTAGGAMALLCNLLARMPGLEGALPVNSVTALIGAPVVCWVLMKKK
ncbi:MAG: iron ABC transporter permease [Bacteroidaceae bacterium]|jgi:iron complex transport system permease protein|nr:iron ABC transporter permease [Bacteroidaceae bacterium]